MTAAHCFCNYAYGKCVENNAPNIGKLRSGHIKFGRGTIRSKISQEIVDRVDVVTPGYLENYDRNTLEIDRAGVAVKTTCL